MDSRAEGGRGVMWLGDTRSLKTEQIVTKQEKTSAEYGTGFETFSAKKPRTQPAKQQVLAVIFTHKTPIRSHVCGDSRSCLH